MTRPWPWPWRRRPRPGHGDVPVGAVALVDGRVIAARHNEREKSGDPTAHAELLALSDAAAALGTWRLSEVTLVVTLEPCPMCAGGLVAARGSTGLRGARPQGRVRADRSTTCVPTPGSIMRSRSPPGSAPERHRINCPRSSWTGAPPAGRRLPERLGPRTASSSLTPGEMPERTNGHASKACEVHSLRGFESPSLRSLESAHEDSVRRRRTRPAYDRRIDLAFSFTRS